MLTDLLLEALLNTLWPVFVEITAPAMHAFDGYDMLPPIALSSTGGVAATLLLWLLGRGLHVMMRMGAFPRVAERYDILRALTHRYGYWLLLLMPLPVGFIIGLAAGFFALPLRIVLPLAALGLAGYYAATLIVL